MPTERQCSRQVYRSGIFQGHPCRKKASVERGGRLYCAIHDPVRIRTKNAEKDRLIQAEVDRKIADLGWQQAAHRVCSGVDTLTLQNLGNGWLEKTLKARGQGRQSCEARLRRRMPPGV
jgi:hypothetical protein